MTEAAHKSGQSTTATHGRSRPAAIARAGSGWGTAAFDTLQGLAGNRAVSSALGGGQPLPPALRDEMEARFGADFDNVRIHDDSEAHASASAMGAKAYTHGHDIVFSANRFAPHAGPGKRLLAHELAHVVQQRRGGAAPALDAHAPHEASAHQAAASVMQGSGPVAVQGGSAVGVARDGEEGGLQGALIERAKRALVDNLLSSVGIPPTGARLGSAVARGMGEQIARELMGKDKGGGGKGALLLGRIAAMGGGDMAQLAKGYYIGLGEGIVSPVTDLFGLAVFGEHMQHMARDMLISAISSHADLTSELQSLENEAALVKKSLADVWKRMKDDPAGSLAALLSLPDAISDLAERKAYELGQQGGSSIVTSLEAPWAKKEEAPAPDLLNAPLAWVESKAKGAEDWALDTPWAQMGSKIGYAIGFVAVQVVLFAFTEGIGNAIEEVGVALGKVGNVLGRLSKAIGTVAGRVAELVTVVGKGIAVVEEAIAMLIGKAFKPLEKLLEPVLKPLGNVLKSLRAFLRKLFGVVEKEGVQLVDAAVGKAGALADDAAKAVPKAAPPPGKPPEPHGPVVKPKAGGAAGIGSEVDEASKAGSAGKKSAKPKPKANEPATAKPGDTQKKAAAANDVEGGAKPPAKKSTGAKKKTADADEDKATSGGKKEAPSKAVPKKPSGKKAAPAQNAGNKASGHSSATKKPATKSSAPKKSPRINDPHGMRQDPTNFDRRTAGAGGIDDISFLKDPDGRYAVKIKGKLQEGLYRGKGKTPPGKTRAPNYNRSRKFVSNREAGLNADWENAHLWGPGFGDEAAAGMMKAPRGVNQWYQNEGIEGWARDLRKAADEMPKIAGKAAEVEVEATAIAWDMHSRAWQPKTQVDFLKRAEYRVKLTTPGGETASVRVTIDVAPPPGSKVVISFDPPTAANPADLLRIVKGTKLK